MPGFDADLTLTSERLVLRPFGPGHAPQVRAIVAAGAASFLPPGAPGHLAGVDQWLNHGVHEPLRSGDGIHLAIEAAGELVGAVSLFKTQWGAGTTEIGYGVHPGHRGRGYAAEAVRLLTSWALGPGGLRRVELRVNFDNAASIRVAEKAGFTREGLLRGGGFEEDGPHDLLVFARIAGDPPMPYTGFHTGVRLESERLLLRPFTAADAPDVLAAVDDPEIRRWMPWAAGYTMETALQWCPRLAHIDVANAVHFALEPKEGGRLAGCAGVHRADWERGYAEVGYWMAPWARRRGYAAEATRRISEYLFERGFQRVHLIVAEGNVASEAVARKAGFTREGVMRRAVPVPGGYVDGVMFSLLRGE